MKSNICNNYNLFFNFYGWIYMKIFKYDRVFWSFFNYLICKVVI
jgi:hypothetical protein